MAPTIWMHDAVRMMLLLLMMMRGRSLLSAGVLGLTVMTGMLLRLRLRVMAAAVCFS